MSFSDYVENKILDHVFRNVTYTAPTVWYVKLHLADPGEAGTSNAAAETTRKSVTFNAASGGQITLVSTATWTNVAASETYSHVSVWDHATAGNCLGAGALAVSKAVTAGDTFDLTALTISLD